MPELLTLRGGWSPPMPGTASVERRSRVIEQGGDYALALEGNRGTLHTDVRLFLDDMTTPPERDTQVGKGHGRIETRIASISTDVGWRQETHQ